MIGTRFGHYRIVEKLGAGGMGEVYRAHDERLERDVAIKLLPAASFKDETARARLLREARAAAALNHTCICTVHEVGEAEGQAYIAMELVDGKPLSDRAQGHALPLDDVLRIGAQIADALAHAHARHIVHRDLKPANVVLASDGRAKVLDFGLAKRLSGTDIAVATTAAHRDASLTAAGTVAGTLAYMSPEQLRGDLADARSDLWALGVVLYELAAGRPPFKGKSSFELSSSILNDAPAALPAAVPVALRAVIEKCLAKRAERRYQSATEVRAALDAIRVGTTSPWASARYKVTRRPFLAAGASAALLAGALLALNGERIRREWFGGPPQVESLAVLPLENLSGDSAQDYFADGMTEVLSTDLARLGGLRRVTARGSVIRYKGTHKTLAEIARELNVDALITGSVIRSGDRIGITVQLLDPGTGDQLWSNRYDRELKDVLALRNDIVSAIVREIEAHLSASEQAQLASARTVHPDAFEAYLKGRFHWYKQTREDFDLAERYYLTALEKDPGYALGYAGLASVWMMRGDAGFAPPSETFPKATTFIAKALELDDKQADLYVALGNHKAAVGWDWAGAEADYSRALAVNPNHAEAHFFYSDLLLIMNRRAESDREMQRARELDPLNDFQQSYYGWHLNYLQRYDDAIAVFEALLPTGPNRSTLYLGLWGAYYRKGMFERAVISARDYFRAAGDRESADALTTASDRTSYRAEMKRLAEAMVQRSANSHIPGIRIARLFAHAGETDAAMHWLENAFANHEPAMMRLGVFWDWYELRSDARFQDLLRRMKLPSSAN